MLEFNPFTGSEHQPFYLPGSGGAALLVHGFPGTPAEMRALGKVLNEADWTAQGLLLPGFGSQFGEVSRYKASDWLAAIRSALQELQKSHPFTLLIGFSMGGGLSLQTAVQQPPDGLVLLAPFWQTTGWFWATMPLFKHIFPRIKPFRALKIDLSNPETRQGIGRFLPGADLDDPQVVAAIRDFEFPLSVLDELRQVGKGTAEAVGQLKTPSLVIQGAKDDWVRPPATQELVRKASISMRYVEVDGAHDLPNPEKPAWEQVCVEILRFAGEIEQVRV